jgi:hypothetical protein
MTVVSLGHEVGNQHPTSTTAAIVVSRRCFISIQLSIPGWGKFDSGVRA